MKKGKQITNINNSTQKIIGGVGVNKHISVKYGAPPVHNESEPVLLVAYGGPETFPEIPVTKDDECINNTHNNSIAQLDENAINSISGGGHVTLTNKDFVNGKAQFKIPVGSKVVESNHKKK